MKKEIKFTKKLSNSQIMRFPSYFNFLMSLEFDKNTIISNKKIADSLDLNVEVVKKDLAAISASSNPRQKRRIVDLIEDLRKVMGLDVIQNAVLIGVGHLGRAFLNYDSFNKYGLKIVAGFDTDERMYEIDINGVNIYPLNKMEEIIKRQNVTIGIICVPSSYAQQTCDLLVSYGIKGIWNFSPVHLRTNDDVIVQSVNMASSFTLLYYQLNLKSKKGE